MRNAKRLLRSLSGEAIWPPPVWLMRQAGRYLPEYREVRAKAGDFITLCTNPALAAEVTLQPLRRYGFDAAILFSDILMIPWAMGQPLRFAEGEGPLLEPVTDAAAIAALDPGVVAARAAPIMETVARLRAAMDRDFPETALIGFAGSPFTVACYMVNGRGGGDFPAARLMAHRDPALFAKLIAVLEEATVVYLQAQVAAGAEVLMLFDSWAGLLPPDGFEAWVVAPTQRIVARMKALCPDVPVIGFPRLTGAAMPGYAVRTGIQGVGMDTTMDPTWAARAVAPEIAIQGNLDPLALVAGGRALGDGARRILAAVKGRPAIFNLGHGIVPQTPPEHVAELMAVIRSEG
ncbi:uroporphyrinogen decarboxylase [Humitalea rosea]|uniref:Uroporphyrinogen decarboxylase n=1 Tax=Humitalea rosea TaxID=990373 RepID=A0A2W7IKP3_9PROT|nr:uroporphyrinogen decarboxylase [Humitalea rosea]PZW46587.1 uroporphyrinogen decarboxylase [Humitalea rosea]